MCASSCFVWWNRQKALVYRHLLSWFSCLFKEKEDSEGWKETSWHSGRNNSFINRVLITFVLRNFWSCTPSTSGFYGRQTKSRQIKIFHFSLRLTKVQCYYNSTNAFKLIFLAKACCKAVFKSAKQIWKPYIFIVIPTIM